MDDFNFTGVVYIPTAAIGRCLNYGTRHSKPLPRSIARCCHLANFVQSLLMFHDANTIADVSRKFHNYSCNPFYIAVTFGYCHRSSVCRLSVVSNIGALYSDGSIFPQYICTAAPYLARYVKKTSRKYSHVFPAGCCYVQLGMKNRDFRPISRFISSMIQDVAIVTM